MFLELHLDPGITKSPSFSRSLSSTKIIILPFLASFKISTIGENFFLFIYFKTFDIYFANMSSSTLTVFFTFKFFKLVNFKVWGIMFTSKK